MRKTTLGREEGGGGLNFVNMARNNTKMEIMEEATPQVTFSAREGE